MALTVLRSSSGEPRVFPDIAEDKEVLLFDPIEERGQDPVGERFRSVDRALQLADSIIFRTSSRQLATRVANDPIIRSLLSETPTYCLGRSYDPRSPSPELVPLTGETDQLDIPIAELMHAEVESILRDTGSILEAEAHHYLLPSEWLAQSFVRLANATRSIPANRRLADWLIGYVDERTAMLADTGTILPLLLEVKSHCNRHFSWRCPVDALEQYPTPQSIAQAIDDLRRRSADEEHSVLFVLSVNSSGRTLNRFTLASNSQIGDRSVVVVEAAQNAPLVAEPLVRIPISAYPPERDGVVSERLGTAGVLVHPASYEQMPAFDVVARPVSPAVASANAGFFQLLSDHDAVRLHYSAESGRHYAVWIDTPKLLQDGVASEEFAELASSMAPSTDLLLVPDGPAVGELLAIGKQAYDLDGHVVPAGDRLTSDAVEHLRAASHVTVLDDTISTGGTLVRIRRAVYDEAARFGENPDVSAVALVMRTVSPAAFEEVCRPFRTAERRTNVDAVFKAFLPAGRECPWCEEMKLLRSWVSKLPSGAQLLAIKRIEYLQRTLDDQFLIGAEDGPRLRTERSFFGSLAPRAAFAAAASATQQLKNELRAQRSAARIEVVGMEPALDAYFDPILLAGLLRTVDKVRVPNIDAQICAKYEGLNALGESLPDTQRLELGWAVVNDVLPETGFAPLLAPVQNEYGELIRQLLRLHEADRI